MDGNRWAPYLASLRMDQAHSWQEFENACGYSHIPSENMVWADKSGAIGYQAVAITPIRHNFSGLVPVPGDGRYEWDGYLPIKALPLIAWAARRRKPAGAPVQSRPSGHAHMGRFRGWARGNAG